jgi:ATP-dependent Clp protease ATP-binding subunit ClpC
VVLLDEFEKAHANVWDLFLQVFDDGRLTDQLGHVADFRHCIIVLTTNLGATSHRSSGLGFAPAGEAFSGDQILRAIGATFRPEFQNRLDKVIVFRPLTRDLMRGILAKELNRVLERRGLKDREWAVEWEASAQEFLLEKGFSPEMGARPLKRAIEQYVIAPLAATIVEQRFPEGDQFVFVRSDGRAIQAEFVDPDSDAPYDPAKVAAPAAGQPPALAAMILAPGGTTAELKALDAEYAAIAETFASPEWEDLKNRLSQTMLAPDFWTRPARHETLARLALIDRIKAAASTAESLRARLAKAMQRAGKSSRELVGRLALQLHLIKQGIADVQECAPIEVAVAIEPALERPGDHQATRQWCEQVAAMYRAWAHNRHMQLAELPGEAARDLPLLLISGFGAHRLLAQEAGLHVLELAEDDKGPARATARVQIAVAPLGDLPAARLRSTLLQALERGPRPHAVVRRYRSEPSPLVRNVNGRAWRTGRLDAVLAGDFDLIAASQVP